MFSYTDLQNGECEEMHGRSFGFSEYPKESSLQQLYLLKEEQEPLKSRFWCKMGLTSLHDLYGLTHVHEGHFMLCNKEEFQVELNHNIVLWQIFVGHRLLSWFPLLLSVICHVFMHCLGSFLLQDMFLNLR